MTRRIQRPYGLWESPLTPGDLCTAVRFSDVAWDTDGRTLVWLEGRGSGGTLVCQALSDPAPRDLTGELSVRARVGCGGGDFAVSRGRAFFVEADGRLFVQDLSGDGSARALTPAFGRCAAPKPSPDGRWLLYVHHCEGIDRVAVVDTEGRHWPQWLSTGADFYMQPVWHRNGRQIAWIEWDHPQMPWDGTRLMVARLRFAHDRLPVLTETTHLAGNAGTAVFQPEFSPDGHWLCYVSDTDGWSTLWRCDLSGREHVRLLADERAEIGLPAWAQGQRVYGFTADSRRLVFTRTQAGFRRACYLELADGAVSPVPELAAFSSLEQIAVSPGRAHRLAGIVSGSRTSPRIVSLDRARLRTHARATAEPIPPEQLAEPEPLTWETAGGQHAHGLLYPPTSTCFEAEGPPPLIVQVHGGPTAQADARFEPEIQYFATRGYAVLAVNYRGSTGYGRAYTEALRGKWGLFDVEDTVSAARYAVDGGRADGDRLVVMGGSAGGYTVLRVLVTHPGLFRAGICRYGISDLFALTQGTHKFELRYLDSLVGPLPECAEAYRERSPLFAVERLRDPIALFQGADDEVVPREQSDAIVASLRARGVPHEYHVYEGEGHGWRRPETIDAYIRAVEAFLRRHCRPGEELDAEH